MFIEAHEPMSVLELTVGLVAILLTLVGAWRHELSERERFVHIRAGRCVAAEANNALSEMLPGYLV